MKFLFIETNFLINFKIKEFSSYRRTEKPQKSFELIFLNAPFETDVARTCIIYVKIDSLTVVFICVVRMLATSLLKPFQIATISDSEHEEKRLK